MNLLATSYLTFLK